MSLEDDLFQYGDEEGLLEIGTGPASEEAICHWGEERLEFGEDSTLTGIS